MNEISLAVLGLSWGMQDLCCIMGVFCCGAQTLVGARGLQRTQASVIVALSLSCSAACGILVPWPGIKSTSPALQGGFLTTGPPGSPGIVFLISFLGLLIESVYMPSWLLCIDLVCCFVIQLLLKCLHHSLIISLLSDVIKYTSLILYFSVPAQGWTILWKMVFRNWCLPGEGNGNPLQYSCLKKSTDRGAWQAAVHGVTWLSTHSWGWREMGW